MPNPNHIYPNDRCVHGAAALLAFPVSCTHSEAVVQMVWLEGIMQCLVCKQQLCCS